MTKVRNDELEVLTEQEIVGLLHSKRMGRLGFGHQNWPVILPVNYVYDEPTVVMRTGAGAKLDDVPMNAVAFEVDDADPAGGWGWSVLVQGPAFEITDNIDEHSSSLRALPVRPWAPGVHDHWLMLTAVRVSGRRFGVVPDQMQWR